LIYIVVSAAVLNWMLISLIHLKFRKAMQQQGIQTKFPALCAPFTNYFVLAFMLMILYIMWNQGFMLSVVMQPLWILLLFVLFKVMQTKKV
ncbi:amino acid permease, partial [Acinetobacter cumulans]